MSKQDNQLSKIDKGNGRKWKSEMKKQKNI